eukprot:scpid38423/ scgid5567/ 
MSRLSEAVAGMAGLSVEVDSRYTDRIGSLDRRPMMRMPPPCFQPPSDTVSHRPEAAGDKATAPGPASSGGKFANVEVDGEQIHECFRCIMTKVHGIGKKRKLLRNYLANKYLVNGEGAEGKAWQLLTLSYMTSVLFNFSQYSYEILNNEFSDAGEFKTFLIDCGVCTFLSKILSNPRSSATSETRYLTHDDYAARIDSSQTAGNASSTGDVSGANSDSAAAAAGYCSSEVAQWQCSAFYAICVVGALAELEEESSRGTATKEQHVRVHRYGDMLVEAGVVKALLSCIAGSHGILEISRGCLALRELTFTTMQAGYAIMEHGAMPMLARLFTPGWFQKRLAKIRDGGGFDSGTRYLLSLGMEGSSFPEVAANSMSVSEAHQRAAFLCLNITENVGAAIAYTMESCKEARSCVLMEPCDIVLSAALQWLEMPLKTLPDQNSTVRAVLVVRQSLNTSIGTVNKILNKNDILEVLDNWLYPNTLYPIPDVLCSYLLLVRLGGNVRDCLASRLSLLEPVCMLVYCTAPTIQEISLRILTALVQHRPDLVKHLLSRHLIGPDMLKRAPRAFAPCIGLLEKLQRACSKAYPGLWRSQNQDAIVDFVGDAASSMQGMTRDQLKELGKVHFQESDYDQAARYYSAALLSATDRPAAADDTDAVLLGNRAECYLRMERYGDVIRDASMAIGLVLIKSQSQPLVVKCAFRRGKAFFRQGQFFLAVSDANFCSKQDTTGPTVQDLHRDAIASLEKSRQAATATAAGAGGGGRTSSKSSRMRTCWGCGVTGVGMKKCSRCEKAYFCGKSCLKENWPRHQKECQKIAAAAN